MLIFSVIGFLFKYNEEYKKEYSLMDYIPISADEVKDNTANEF